MLFLKLRPGQEFRWVLIPIIFLYMGVWVSERQIRSRRFQLSGPESLQLPCLHGYGQVQDRE